MSKIPFRIAVNATLSILCLVITFHLLVLVNVVPYTIVWGGRIQNEAQLRDLEIVSVIINAFVIFIVLVKGQHINLRIPISIINIILWLLMALFAFNTISNLFAKTLMETIIFTPSTLILALLCFRIVKGDQNESAAKF